MLEFDKIIIYDYNSLNKVSDILNENNLLSENIIITRKNCYFEHDSYQQMIDTNKDLDWLCLFDTDEFLYIKEGTIKNFLEKYDDNVCTILVNWVVFGSGGLKNYDIKKPIYEQFITRESYNHFWNVFPKSIIRPKLINNTDYISVHIVESKKYLTMNVYNKEPEHKYNDACQCIDQNLSDDTPLVLFHYMTLDLESMLEKRNKYKSIGFNFDRYSLEWYYNYNNHPPQSFKDDIIDERMKLYYNKYFNS